MTAATRWSLAIVGLLVGNLVAMVVLAVLANRGDDRVIPSYYDRAVHHDDAVDERARSRQLGWTAAVSVIDGIVTVVVLDPRGDVLRGAHVRVSGFHRAHAGERFELELSSGEGRYQGALAARRAGVYDLTIVVERDGQRFQHQAVVEAT